MESTRSKGNGNDIWVRQFKSSKVVKTTTRNFLKLKDVIVEI